MNVKRPLSNWSKMMLGLCLALILLINPFTRHLIFLILPLDSGMDDFVFLVVLFAACVVAMMRVFPIRNPLRKLAEWFLK